MLYKIFKLLATSQPSIKFKFAVNILTGYGYKSRFIRRKLHRYIFYKFGCDISYKANIDESVNFIHPLGIVIGSQVIINKGCNIYQQTTFGSTKDKIGMPTVESGCIIYAGAKLIGNITIGENSIIGANSVITKNIPKNLVVVGFNKIVRNKP